MTNGLRTIAMAVILAVLATGGVEAARERAKRVRFGPRATENQEMSEFFQAKY